MNAKESTIVTAIMRRLRRMPGNGVALKMHGSAFGRAGVPDILFVCKGKLYMFEVKRPGGRPTRIQRHMIRKFRSAGATVRVVSSVEEVEEVL